MKTNLKPIGCLVLGTSTSLIIGVTSLVVVIGNHIMPRYDGSIFSLLVGGCIMAIMAVGIFIPFVIGLWLSEKYKKEENIN
jgi:hypothetical protein